MSRRSRVTRWTRLAAALAVILAATSPAPAENATMTVDRATVLGFMRAATPYSVEVTTAGFTQTFTFANPRELSFQGGKARFKVDVRSEPLGVSAVLEPTMTLRFDHARGAYVAQVESLPISLAGMGTVRLDRHIDPVVVPTTFISPLDATVPGVTLETIVRELKILDDRLEARVDLLFRRTDDAARQRAAR